MQRTNNLRYVRRVDGTHTILQQQWIDNDPSNEGPTRIEWRDIPIEDEAPRGRS